MKRTIKLYKPETFTYADGTTEYREEVTVTPRGKSLDGRTVWAEVEDDSMLYTYEAGLLWRFDGELL